MGNNTKEQKSPTTTTTTTATAFQTPYTPPQHGILATFSPCWRPYAELARLDKPGYALLWIVHLCGVLQASILNGSPPRQAIYLGVYFTIACQVLMWINFAWNDTCDVKFDGKVLRTRHRPLVRGALTLRQAVIFDTVLAVALVLLLLPLKGACAIYAVPLAFGCFIYPLSKRATNYPQVVLGVVLAGGVYMGAAAVGVDGLPYPGSFGDIIRLSNWIQPSKTDMVALAGNYATVVVWVVFTETVYSFQDVEWDEAAGVGTITRILPDYISAKVFLSLLAVVQVALFACTGVSLEFNSSVWLFSVCLTAFTLALTIVRVNLKSADSCLSWFQAGNAMTGIAMLIGYAGEYALRERVVV